MNIEGYWCKPEEFTLGIFLAFGQDEILGEVHITTIGIGFFALDITFPINQ